MQLIDLSQTIEPGMPMFSPTAPPVKVGAWLTHEQSAQTGRYEGCVCAITEVSFVTSVGTYMDAPYHFHPDRAAIHALSLEQLILPGVVIDCSNVGERTPIEPDVLDGVAIAGKAVLFRTDWSRYWGQPEYYRYPYLTGATAITLQQGGAKLAGVDFLAIDDLTNPRRPVHVHLLGHDILIVENLTHLAALPKSEFIFHAAPVKVKMAVSFPVRAYAVVIP